MRHAARLPALLLGLAFPVQAAALSCMPHDPARTFERIDAAPETYIAVHGTLKFDQGLLPEVDMSDQQAIPPETRIPARISGKALGKAGFTHAIAAPLVLISKCFGPWCAQPQSGADVLAFLRQDGEDLHLSIDPCGGDTFVAPTPETLQKVQDCFASGDCTAAQP